MDKSIKLWQLTGIATVFTFICSLFLPFKTITPNTTIFTYEVLYNKFIELLNFIIHMSFTNSFTSYILNYAEFMAFILLFISLIGILWNSLSKNILLTIISTLFYIPTIFVFVFNLSNSANIISYGSGYYLIIISISLSILIIIQNRIFSTN